MAKTGMRSPLVVIGASARMLAVSAARAGFYPVAIDLFADSDTRVVARCVALPSLEERPVLDALKKVAAQFGRPSLVYGSAIDTRPDLVERFSDFADLIGNFPSVLRTMHSPRSFFGLLDSLAIPYPETCFSRPEYPHDWLFKIPFTEGGRGVLSGWAHPDVADGYYQKKLDGPAMSVLFLANRRDARILGFNTQWIAGPAAPSPYLFSGIMNSAELTIQQKRQLGNYATKLVKAGSLAGLISLDFLIDDGECRVLELNPRPSMSLSLYDNLFPNGLLAEHIRAVRGLQMRRPASRSSGLRGLEIVYSEQPCVVGRDVQWPIWTADRPVPGTKIRTGEPICTVSASAATAEALRTLLARRKQQMQDYFFRVAEDNL